jgi:hypothetical protein
LGHGREAAAAEGLSGSGSDNRQRCPLSATSDLIRAGRYLWRPESLNLRGKPIWSYSAAMPKLPPAIRYGIDAVLILVPLLSMTYFLFNPAAFNAFTAWLARVL